MIKKLFYLVVLISELSLINSVTVINDTDGDGWDNSGNGGFGHDLCPNLPGTNQYQGCPYKYTKISCSNDNGGTVTFDEATHKLHCNDGGNFWGNKLMFSKTTLINDYSNPFSNDLYYSGPFMGSGEYKCKNLDFIPPGEPKMGECKLRLNTKVICHILNIKGSIIKNISQGETIKFHKYKQELKIETKNQSNFKTFTCGSSGGSVSIPNLFNHINLKKLDKIRYKGIIRNNLKRLELKDGNNLKKFSCNTENNKCYFKKNKTQTQTLNLTPINNLVNLDNIFIYKFDHSKNKYILNKSEKVDPQLIALKMHKIKNFKDVNSAKKFLTKSVSLMEKFKIIKSIKYDNILNTTYINISILNYTGSGQIQNLTIYQILDKSSVKNLNEITFLKDGGAERFIMDKDPVIGWYFNSSTGNNSINYNISGNTTSGTTILSQTPILLNEGELVINYRQTPCNTNEVNLFDLSNLENSKILNKNTGNYKICIGDINSSINLGQNLINNLNISSYIPNSNISSNFNEFPNKLNISTDNSNIYWDLKIQESNPNGNFSCLGSFDKVGSSSLFGDCGYNISNRIWLHLGADYDAPKTIVKVPFTSHTIQVKLIATDNIGGSGVNKTYYCVINSSNNCLIKGNFKTYTNQFSLTCKKDWSCTKTLKYYSTDKAGNIENTNSNKLYLIDKGSACQADCTAKPTPLRYLKECRNLNGCHYAKNSTETGNNIGLDVANRCNFLTKDSWVNFNSTTDIKCPAGPFRPTTFTNEKLSIDKNKNCKNLVKKSYPILYNGETIMMDIISCNN